jgi:hypothetical protein
MSALSNRSLCFQQISDNAGGSLTASTFVIQSDSLSYAREIARVRAAKETLRILQELEMNDFDGITTGDESWFQHATASSKMFARLTVDVIPRTQQAVGAKRLCSRCFHRKETYYVRCSSKR